MLNISNFTYENCGKRCKNFDHAQKICNVLLTNHTISDDKIAAFIGKTCKNFAHILDQQVIYIIFNQKFN